MEEIVELEYLLRRVQETMLISNRSVLNSGTETQSHLNEATNSLVNAATQIEEAIRKVKGQPSEAEVPTRG